MVWMDGNALLAKWKNPAPRRGVQLNAPTPPASSRQGRPRIARQFIGGNASAGIHRREIWRHAHVPVVSCPPINGRAIRERP